jgi:hypothetical protein
VRYVGDLGKVSKTARLIAAVSGVTDLPNEGSSLVERLAEAKELRQEFVDRGDATS